ncbi:MAG TPA: carboxypeptidase-like regulatory domain-containing protein [Flavobacterium sp.]|nr:carboxypeptidase-like regulatory domain-containing protein [Flavobacterium sp.]
MKGLFFLLVLFSFSVKAQTISGTVMDEKGTPLEYVSVFFDNSTTETQTDTNGNFSISIPENNRNLLVFSAFGYQYYVVENPKPQQNLKITLQLEDNEMEELVIDQTAFSRKEFLRAFRYFFIGNTKNAKRTKIVNEEVLSFYFDKSSNTFYAYADEPIKVEN